MEQALNISFAPIPKTASSAALVFLVGEDKQFPPLLQSIDDTAKGMIRRAVEGGRFAGKKGQSLTLPAPEASGATHLVLLGVGEAGKLTPALLEAAGGSAIGPLNAVGAKDAAILAALPTGAGVSETDAAARLAHGAFLRNYRFDKYRTKLKAEEKPSLASLAILTGDAKGAQKAYAPLDALARGVVLTRNLVSEPANIINPETLADACRGLEEDGIEVDILGEPEMQKLGMGAILGVGQGSACESQLVVMRWNGGAGDDEPVMFVGKGVTFDTGGISIKPAGGMEEMKWDMGGAGAVIGLMKALAARKAKANVIGVVGLVENMPSGTAQRPGDVVTSMSGQTIEVLNTDAEGRLVLADALWYAQTLAQPKVIIDLATLTGAVIIALGSSRAGLFANDDALAGQLVAAGEATGEKLWRLPLGEEYDRQINSDIADMQNIGKEREAGSTMGAVFLQRFIKEGTKWAHLDIAGTAWTKKELDTCPKGATAFGVRLLDKYVKENHEGK